MALHLFTSRVHNDLQDLRDVVDLTECHLKAEVKRLESRLSDELNKITDENEREFTIGWYTDDFVRLDKVYPNIQRRALFLTLMCMTEADLLLACEMCCLAYDIPKKFIKKGNERTIVQAMSYLQEHLTIREQLLTPHWDYVQGLWSIRNAIVHKDGKPKPSQLDEVTKFCAPIPTLELDHHNRIILKEGSVEVALHGVNLFFSSLIHEIERNKLPVQSRRRSKADESA
jgi:hypothetical protein